MIKMSENKIINVKEMVKIHLEAKDDLRDNNHLLVESKLAWREVLTSSFSLQAEVW